VLPVAVLNVVSNGTVSNCPLVLAEGVIDGIARCETGDTALAFRRGFDHVHHRNCADVWVRAAISVLQMWWRNNGGQTLLCINIGSVREARLQRWQ